MLLSFDQKDSTVVSAGLPSERSTANIFDGPLWPSTSSHHFHEKLRIHWKFVLVDEVAIFERGILALSRRFSSSILFILFAFTDSRIETDSSAIDMTDLVLDFGDKISLNMGKQTINVQVHGRSNEDHEEKFTILSLNDDVFQEILSHLPYDEIAKLRLVFHTCSSSFFVLIHVSLYCRLIGSSMMYAKKFWTKVSCLFSDTTIAASKRWKPSCQEGSQKEEHTLLPDILMSWQVYFGMNQSGVIV